MVSLVSLRSFVIDSEHVVWDVSRRQSSFDPPIDERILIYIRFGIRAVSCAGANHKTKHHFDVHNNL